MIARRFYLDADSPVGALPSGAPLPAGLVIAPGYYTHGGITNDCTQEGLYRFWTPMVSTLHRIVYAADVQALMSGLAWLTVHGRADEALSVSARTTAALNYKLRLLCGKTVEWANAICASLGLQSRICHAVTASTPSNYYDGHVLLEVNVGGVWKLFDIANDCFFGGLPLKDVVPLTASISNPPLAVEAVAQEQFLGAVLDVTSWRELTMHSPEQRRAEMERVLQIPGITHTDGLTYFYMPSGSESRQAWLLSLDPSYRVLMQSAWLTQFYS